LVEPACSPAAGAPGQLWGLFPELVAFSHRERRASASFRVDKRFEVGKNAAAIERGDPADSVFLACYNL